MFERRFPGAAHEEPWHRSSTSSWRIRGAGLPLPVRRQRAGLLATGACNSLFLRSRRVRIEYRSPPGDRKCPWASVRKRPNSSRRPAGTSRQDRLGLNHVRSPSRNHPPKRCCPPPEGARPVRSIFLPQHLCRACSPGLSVLRPGTRATIRCRC